MSDDRIIDPELVREAIHDVIYEEEVAAYIEDRDDDEIHDLVTGNLQLLDDFLRARSRLVRGTLLMAQMEYLENQARWHEDYGTQEEADVWWDRLVEAEVDYAFLVAGRH